MKQLTLNLLLSLIAISLLQLTSCNSAEDIMEPDQVIPEIGWNGGLDYQAKAGETFEIEGTNLSEEVVIKIGEVEITDKEVTETSIKFEIPTNLSSGDLIITHMGKQILKDYFKVLEGGFEYVLERGRGFTHYDFTNSNTGYYTEGDQLYKTIDGGKNWISILDEPNLYTIYTISEQETWIKHQPWNFLKTSDGGATWNEINPDGKAYLRGSYVNENSAFVLTYSADKGIAKLLYSEDQGLNWSKITDSEEFEDLGEFEIISGSGNGITLYNHISDVFLETTDFENWESRSIPVNIDPRSSLEEKGIFAMSKDEIWISTYRGLASTEDGGITWNEQTFNFADENDPIGRIHFFNESEGMAISGSGGILRTNDGGENWTLTYLSAGLFEADFIDIDKSAIIGQGDLNGFNFVKIEF